MRRADILLLLAASTVFTCLGCGKIEGPNFPYIASPRALVHTPASPAEGDITTSFQLIDREHEQGTVILEYSTDNGQTFSACTLVDPAEATGLSSAWYPGRNHTIQWDSVSDGLALSGDATVCVKVTPSDASNPSGTAGVSGAFTVNNTAYNQPPSATTATPGGVQFGNIPINYFLADVESDTCSIVVEYSPDDGANWNTATMGAAGEGLTGLSSSPAGTAHTFLWDSRADNVAPSSQLDTVKVRITPTDFHVGTAGETNSFSVDNSITNDPPTVNITGGPAQGSTVSTDQVTFNWSGSDTDGSVIGYYYSFDHDPPDIWTTDTSVTSGVLSEGSHTFRVVAVDDQYDLSAVASRTFTVSLGVITAGFIASPTSGDAPLTVYFTDQSTATNGIDTWSWSFGDTGTSTNRDPVHIYTNGGTFTVSLTVTGPDGSDTETKTAYITVTGSPAGDTIYVDGTNGNDSWDGLSWGTAVEHIQTGLDKASGGWAVLVANGTYTGTSNKNLDFSGKAVHLKSAGGASNCIVDCQLSGRGFDFHSGETAQANVEGITIQNGSVIGGNGFGGGILIRDNSHPTIVGCVVSGCTAENTGGGIDCGADTNSTISNCVISGNSSLMEGGGIACFGGSPTFKNCIIQSNTSANGGGILYRSSTPVLVNCLIIGNTSTGNGGGVFCMEDIICLTNCVIADNHCNDDGGGIYADMHGTAALENTILWGNNAVGEGHQLHSGIDGNITLNYSCFADNTLDSNNIKGSGSVLALGGCKSLDPQFMNAASGDYHLQSGSPCIDAGDNLLVPPGITTDLDGNIRIFDGDGDTTATVDMGAYEWGAPAASFAKTWGGSKGDALNAVAAGATGYYCAGGTTSFGAGLSDALLLKYDGSGALQWARTWGGEFDEDIEAVAMDSAGSLYCAGRANSFGGTLLLKCDGSGNFQWARTWDIGNSEHLQGVALDSAGSIYCAGATNMYGGSSGEALILKYDSSGNLQWVRTWGGTSHDAFYGITIDSADGVYCAGTTHSFGTDSNNALLVKWDSTGTVQWARKWGGDEADILMDVATDSGGSVYCTGRTQSFSAGSADTLLLKYDSSGNLQWVRTWSGDDWNNLEGMAVNSAGDIYCVGNLGASYGEYDSALVLHYDTSGNLQWARIWDGASTDYLRAVAFDTAGNVILAGGTLSYVGTWQAVTTGTEGVPVGTTGSPAGTVNTPSGTEGTPTGTESSPTGSDSGAGSSDTLLLKNW